MHTSSGLRRAGQPSGRGGAGAAAHAAHAAHADDADRRASC